MVQEFINKDGRFIIENLIKVIEENADYLDELDGAIGDGDHGVNMSKGFVLCAEDLKRDDLSFSSSLEVLGQTFAMEIHDLAGPLYGAFFLEMALAIRHTCIIDKDVFGRMLDGAMKGVQDIGCAELGDKTILDALIPAVEAYKESKRPGFSNCPWGNEKGCGEGQGVNSRHGRQSRESEQARGKVQRLFRCRGNFMLVDFGVVC